MRKTTLKAVDNSLYLDLGSDTTLIGEIMEIGRYIPELIYEVELSGIETIKLLKECYVNEEIIKHLTNEKRYILTSYDW